MRSGGSLASRDVDSESTRSPMAMVFVGSILGFAVLAFVMCVQNSYLSFISTMLELDCQVL